MRPDWPVGHREAEEWPDVGGQLPCLQHGRRWSASGPHVPAARGHFHHAEDSQTNPHWPWEKRRGQAFSPHIPTAHHFVAPAAGYHGDPGQGLLSGVGHECPADGAKAWRPKCFQELVARSSAFKTDAEIVCGSGCAPRSAGEAESWGEDQNRELVAWAAGGGGVGDPARGVDRCSGGSEASPAGVSLQLESTRQIGARPASLAVNSCVARPGISSSGTSRCSASPAPTLRSTQS